jgi:DNA segregation ATPase FtsK/SpoIIIE-like protein
VIGHVLTGPVTTSMKKMRSAIAWLVAVALRLAKRLAAPGAGPKLVSG